MTPDNLDRDPAQLAIAGLTLSITEALIYTGLGRVACRDFLDRHELPQKKIPVDALDRAWRNDPGVEVIRNRLGLYDRATLTDKQMNRIEKTKYGLRLRAGR